MPRANEMVRLRDRKIARALGIELWKVTARYTVQVTRTQNLQCVRVHGFCGSGQGIVRHLSLKEFDRLFERR